MSALPEVFDGCDVAPLTLTGPAYPLAPDIDPGTVVVADRIVGGDGRAREALLASAPRLASAPLLASAIRRLGLPVRVGAVVASASGADRIAGGPNRAPGAAPPAEARAIAAALALLPPPGVLRDRPVAVVQVVVESPAAGTVGLPTSDPTLRIAATLRAAAPALGTWAAAAGHRRILLAGPRSFCAGVERAIETVERALMRHGAPLYVRRQIVHNRHVVEDLEARGAVFVRDLDEVPDGATVVFSAHGVAPSVRAESARRSLGVIDATCPLVAKVHRDLHRFREKGYQVVLVGHAGHDETEGTLGEDRGVRLVERPEDVERLEVLDDEKVAYVTQTTLSPEDVSGVVGALSRRFPGVEGPHAADICYATQNRQEAVRAIAPVCDLLLVVGSPNSSNTARLVEVARRVGCPAEMIDDENDIDLGWLIGTSTVGVTAGASAPPWLVAGVVDAVAGLGSVDVEERPVRTENVSFPLPPEVR